MIAHPALCAPAQFGTVALAVLLSAHPALAQQRPFTYDEARRVASVSSPQPSPDGKTVAIVVTRLNFADNRNESELFAVDVASGSTRQLTHGRHVVGMPRWSPDGNTLAFLARDSVSDMQVWLLSMQGGESRQLTRVAEGVAHFSWRPDGGAIAFASTDPAPTREGEARHVATFRIGEQDLFLREELRPQHIWIQALDGTEPRRVTSGSWTLEFVLPPGSPPSRLSWSPDGRSIAFTRMPAALTGKSDSVNVAVVDVTTGAIRSLTGAKAFQNSPVYSPDGAFISYWYPREGRYDLGWVNEVHVAPATGGTGRSITRALDRNFYSAEWMPDGKAMLVTANDQTRVGVWLQPLDGAARRLDLGELVVNGAYGYEIAVARTGAIAFVATTPSRPPELYVMDSPAAKPRRLTDFNAWATQVAFGRMERVTWKGPDSLQTFDEDGVLVYPPNFNPSSKYPLVLVIHGGPTSASKTGFAVLPQLMVREGWVVFMPNYRGSDNLGNAYQSAIVGDWGAGPGRDVMAGVTELRKRAWVDGTRTAVTGWSYGGYMTTWLAGNYPDQWTVAMAGAPVTNFEDQYNLADGNVAWRYLFGGSPWVGDFAKLYREQSPITYATRIKAPTLIMSNMEDFRVPPTQAMALYRALKDNGVTTEFIGFPGRTHASGDPVNAMERNRLWLEWVKKHLAPQPRVQP
jgi:dipeptidyl aminopeptidase/acylaminoacyl peptidase